LTNNNLTLLILPLYKIFDVTMLKIIDHRHLDCIISKVHN